MNKRKFSVAGLLIFIAGIFAVTLASWFLLPEFLTENWRGGFITVSVAILYTVLAFPVIFVFQKMPGNGSWLIGGTVYYRGAGIYAVLSLGMTWLTADGLLPLRGAIAGEIVALFLYVVYTYLACISKAHIDNVQQEEESKTRTLIMLKQKAIELQVKTGQMDGDQADIRDRVARLTENLRYLSPSGQAEAQKLEDQMLDVIIYLADFIPTDTVSAEQTARGTWDYLRQQLDEIENLYRMRKNIY